MPTFIVKYQNRYLKIQNGCIVWTTKDHANAYSSRYAAKKHLRTLELPSNAPITIEAK